MNCMQAEAVQEVAKLEQALAADPDTDHDASSWPITVSYLFR